MSTQAWVVAIVYLLCIVIGIVGSITSKTFTMWSALGAFVGILVLLLVTYDTACLTNGYCGAWSWVRTVLYVIVPVIVLVIFFFAIVFGKKTKPPQSLPAPVVKAPVATATTTKTTARSEEEY